LDIPSFNPPRGPLWAFSSLTDLSFPIFHLDQQRGGEDLFFKGNNPQGTRPPAPVFPEGGDPPRERLKSKDVSGTLAFFFPSFQRRRLRTSPLAVENEPRESPPLSFFPREEIEVPCRGATFFSPSHPPPLQWCLLKKDSFWLPIPFFFFPLLVFREMDPQLVHAPFSRFFGTRYRDLLEWLSLLRLRKFLPPFFSIPPRRFLFSAFPFPFNNFLRPKFNLLLRSSRYI